MTSLTPQKKEAILQRSISDLKFTAQLSRYPTLVRELIKDPRMKAMLEQDPVFFALLICGAKWLLNAPVHQTLLRDESTRIVAVCGRGWGKSLIASLKAVCQYLFRYRDVEVLIVSSSQRQSMQIFSYLEHEILDNPILCDYVGRHTRTLITLRRPFGGRVEALPCSPNHLRGKHPDVLIVDEASIIPSEMLTSELLMMLTKKGARILLLGTPWSWDHPLRRAYGNGEYTVYHAASHTSPLVNLEQLEQWKSLMTVDEWRREVEAEWTQPANAYFVGEEVLRCVDPDLQIAVEDNISKEGEYYLGVDFGKARDHTAIVVTRTENEKVKVVFLKELPLGTNYTAVIGYLQHLREKIPFQGGYVDATGVGAPITEELEEAAPEVEGLIMTVKSKEDMMANMKLMLERRELVLPDYRPLLNQIQSQQYDYGRGGRLLFTSAPGCKHDDLFYALALSAYAASHGAMDKVGPMARFF